MNPNRTMPSTGKIIGMTVICILVMTVFVMITQSCNANSGPGSEITQNIATEDLQKLMNQRYNMSAEEVETELGDGYSVEGEDPVVWRYSMQNDIDALLTFSENGLELAKLEKGDTTVGLQLSTGESSGSESSQK